MKKSLPVFIAIFLLSSCTEPPEIEGLWELKDISVDMIPGSSNPVFIKFEKGGSFSVSRAQGDLIGLYELNNNNLYLTSSDEKWFNTSWNANVYQDKLVLKGLEYGYRTTELKFVPAIKLPPFNEFIEAITGKWELYKINIKGKSEVMQNMEFIISEEFYTISKNDSTIEKGLVVIDPRHQKINFENEGLIWNVRFVWDELRLENEELDIKYRLRRY